MWPTSRGDPRVRSFPAARRAGSTGTAFARDPGTRVAPDPSTPVALDLGARAALDLGAAVVLDTGAGAGGRVRGERGSATVEAAIAVCAVVAVLAMALGGAATVLAQLRCTDAAREAARLVARGEQGRAAEVAGRIAPGGAAVDIRVGGDEVVVVVTAEPVGGLGLLSVRAEAMAVLEPGAAGAG